MKFTPGAFNIVPARVDVALEFRSADEEEFQQLNMTLLERAYQEARAFWAGIKSGIFRQAFSSIDE